MVLAIHVLFFNFCLHLLIFERERETESMRVGEGQREETQNPKKAPGSEQGVSTEPNVGLEPTNCEIMTLAEVGCSTDQTTQVP